MLFRARAYHSTQLDCSLMIYEMGRENKTKQKTASVGMGLINTVKCNPSSYFSHFFHTKCSLCHSLIPIYARVTMGCERCYKAAI